MDEEEKIGRLQWNGGASSPEEAKRFMRLYYEMQDIDRDETEERRIVHAREMSQRRR
jgi:hypothetical protein